MSHFQVGGEAVNMRVYTGRGAREGNDSHVLNLKNLESTKVEISKSSVTNDCWSSGQRSEWKVNGLGENRGYTNFQLIL